MTDAEHAMEPLRQWLEEGQSWLADMQAAGLSGAAYPLLHRGRAWANLAALLGWATLARQMDIVLDPGGDPQGRAAALLDVLAWVTTAERLWSCEAQSPA